MNESTFIILGASGDLARKKLFPALYKLLMHKKLTNFAIVGAAWDKITIDDIYDAVRPSIENIDEKLFAQMRERSSYLPIDFSSLSDFTELNKHVQTIEKKYSLSGNRIIYCASASDYFCAITENAAKSGLAKKQCGAQTPWHRIVFEKPFGHDVQSAHEINECIAQYFHEDQIYRIDHYLTKELVGNIALIRFTNCVLEPLWNNRYIDNVQIIASEEIDIENRGDYYDRYGALKDMVQNHILELLALIGMESPEKLSGEYIRTERTKVLEKIEVVDAILGQYDGYNNAKDVPANSKTETFAQLYLRVNNLRWNGVPFIIKTGKGLDKKETVIHVKFKQVDCLLARYCPSESNYLTIRINPEASFILNLNAKKPGHAQEVTPIKMEFCHSCEFGTITPESYEVIFEEILKGEQSISVRFDEIEAAWKVIDTVKKLNLPVYSYTKGSTGPDESKTFMDKHGIRWLS